MFYYVFGDCLYNGKIINGTIVGKVFFINIMFFSNGLIKDDVKEDGKVPVRKKRLTMERIVRQISLAIFLRTVIMIGSRL